MINAPVAVVVETNPEETLATIETAWVVAVEITCALVALAVVFRLIIITWAEEVAEVETCRIAAEVVS